MTEMKPFLIGIRQKEVCLEHDTAEKEKKDLDRRTSNVTHYD